MVLEQIYLGCLSQAAYLVGDADAGIAAVVDPRRDTQAYLDRAEALGVTIEHVLLTHFHADFLAGHLELAAQGATIHLGARGKAEFEHHPLADGDELRLGSVRIRALETPGHTPEGLCFLVFEGDAAEPHAVLTGDTFFVGDVGRPDLMASVGVTKEELANQLYDSLHEKLLTLPDATLLYPGHGAGSACGKALSDETHSTIGTQKALNPLLRASREDFVAQVTDQGTPPAYFGYTAGLNRKPHPLLDEAIQRGRTPLGYADVADDVAAGRTQLLDVRAPDAFAEAHAPGSINVWLDGRFAGWAGAVLDPQRPIAMICDDAHADEALTRLARIGFEAIGIVDPTTITSPVAAPRVEADEAREGIAKQGWRLLDVRSCGERDRGYVAGSLHVPLPELPARVAEIPRDKPLVVQCGSGYRSSIAASLLRRAGPGEVLDQRGGFQAWSGW